MPPPRDDTGALQLGIVPLRPLKLGDILSGTVRVLRLHPGSLLGLSFATAVLATLGYRSIVSLIERVPPETLITLSSESATWGLVAPYLLDGVLNTFITALLGVLLIGVVNVVVPRAVFGHTTGPREAMRLAWPSFWRLLANILVTTVLIGTLGLGTTLMLLPALVSSSVLALPLVVVILFLAVAFVFSSSVVVMEDAGPFAALRRSHQLVRVVGWWRVFGIVLFFGVLMGLLGILVDLVTTGLSGGSVAGEMLADVLVSTVSTPVTAIVPALLYFDHRARAEGIEGLWRRAG